MFCLSIMSLSNLSLGCSFIKTAQLDCVPLLTLIINEVKNDLCKKWYDLTPLSMAVSFVKDVKRIILDTYFEIKHLFTSIVRKILHL